MNNGTNKLAMVLTERMRRENAPSKTFDFGTVTRRRGLLTDALQVAMPIGEYQVLEHVGDLLPGDRVVVAWAGPEAVVIGKTGGNHG